MDKKYSTIQELESIKFEDFKDKPYELVQIGKDLLNAKRFEKSIEVFEEALKQNIKSNNDEFSIQCAKFYYYYADALIYKLQETGEMFQSKVVKESKDVENNNFEKNKITNNVNEDEILISNMEDTKNYNIDARTTGNFENNNNNVENDFDEEESEEEDEESDEKIAFYNLAVSEKILKSFLKKYEGIPTKELPPKIIDYFLDLSDIFLKYGELEQIKSDFKTACDFYNQSLLLKNIYDDKYSRAVAEVYYIIGNAADFDAKKALSCYYKTYLIMMKHLKKEWKEEFEINIDFENVKLEDLKIEVDLMSCIPDDKEVVKELKEIIRELKQKIEDVSEEVKIMDIYEKEKQSIKKEEFSKNYDEKSLIDLNKAGVIKKRKREDINTINGNENVPSGKIAKISENGTQKIIETIIPNKENIEKTKVINETEEK